MRVLRKQLATLQSKLAEWGLIEEWEGRRLEKNRRVLGLNRYLSRNLEVMESPDFNLHCTAFAITFSRLLPATSNLPEITVGLGLFPDLYLDLTQIVLPSYPVRKPFAVPNAMDETGFLAKVSQKRKELGRSPNWQENLLLDLGYARTIAEPRTRGVAVDSYRLFHPIPEEERRFLLDKHGLHKIAVMVSFGHTQDLDALITALDHIEGGRKYPELLHLTALGVPVEDLELTLQLPEEMVKELYG